jgi:hypothetical protein
MFKNPLKGVVRTKARFLEIRETYKDGKKQQADRIKTLQRLKTLPLSELSSYNLSTLLKSKILEEFSNHPSYTQPISDILTSAPKEWPIQYKLGLQAIQTLRKKSFNQPLAIQKLFIRYSEALKPLLLDKVEGADLLEVLRNKKDGTIQPYLITGATHLGIMDGLALGAVLAKYFPTSGVYRTLAKSQMVEPGVASLAACYWWGNQLGSMPLTRESPTREQLSDLTTAVNGLDSVLVYAEGTYSPNHTTPFSNDADYYKCTLVNQAFKAGKAVIVFALGQTEYPNLPIRVDKHPLFRTNVIIQAVLQPIDFNGDKKAFMQEWERQMRLARSKAIPGVGCKN